MKILRPLHDFPNLLNAVSAYCLCVSAIKVVSHKRDDVTVNQFLERKSKKAKLANYLNYGTTSLTKIKISWMV